MAMRTITRLFDTHDHALAAVRDLEAAGFRHEDVSILANNADGRYGDAAVLPGERAEGHADTAENSESGAGIGATLGTVLGGGAGLAAGLGALAIPGVGPVVAAGWLVATLTGAGAGAAAGGLLGALTGAGVSESEAGTYAEGVRRGGTLVTVRSEDARIDEAERILASHGPVDATVREADYRAGGWTGYRDDDDLNTLEAGRGTASAPDGTPGNPPGTAATRAADRAAGTNLSGAYPEQSDGTPANPKGTVASRGFDRVAGTNTSGTNPTGTGR
ncbi:hypothetical protein MVG78_18730 [Roseomonas gilardii subsp. gilardii]|uniref:hypothetical protein n=1 Tax=Roseomonas gilardii TaxID=257708 RepID=UPI001FFA93CE|nr:hypothetical protein [Roseomonas gilardii]UPG72488.1 hypothetical protein MVG78_18730 [Roseomonas gilardii subsp. gilardii]